MFVQQFLAADNREHILAAVGRHFFGDGPSDVTARAKWEQTRRKWVKELFNSLDNDGTVGGWKAWCARVGRPLLPGRTAEGARATLPDGSTFTLQAYVGSRADMTAEFEGAVMPGMCAFVSG